jgi:hypothetical protein
MTHCDLFERFPHFVEVLGDNPLHSSLKSQLSTSRPYTHYMMLARLRSAYYRTLHFLNILRISFYAVTGVI